MKATINNQTVEGFYGPDNGTGARWLFVKSPATKKSYSVALVANGAIVKLDREQALRNFTNEQIATALLAAS